MMATEMWSLVFSLFADLLGKETLAITEAVKYSMLFHSPFIFISKQGVQPKELFHIVLCGLFTEDGE